ncbi:N-acetylmuramoyl-L-alanine amidase [Anaerocolumna sp.]|uniref:N-acetylmuramoyl-L-alanine amidase n=1 Tax=Anaerocolumna sp. TaxID=2041569 RepID=UPI0028AC69EA|nr:N-acetylmuramoyl-L-alanine amidase [Anaerocolumna sp.]
MANRVVIDPGHGGVDSGAVYGNRLEKNDNLNLALAVGKILEGHGVEVLYSRTEDVYSSPIKRAQVANAENADLFIALHRNSSPLPNTYSGVVTLMYDEKGIKPIAAELINRELEKVGFPDLGIDIRKDLPILKRTNMPALSVNVGFINTDSDNLLFDEQFEAIANGIAAGILETLNMMNETTENTHTYRVQVGLFGVLANAVYLQYQLMLLGYEPLIVSQGDLYAVQIGELPSLDQAVMLEQELKRVGYDTLIVRYE